MTSAQTVHRAGLRAIVALLGLAALSACTAAPEPPASGVRMLAIGDSILAWNRGGGGSIPEIAAAALGREVTNRATPLARISHPLPGAALVGLDIPRQFPDGDWGWVILDGGGNDLGSEGGCGADASVLNGLISPDGTRGEIPELVLRITASGAQAMYVGYTPPPPGGPFAGCRTQLDALDARLARMAATIPRAHHVAAAEVVAADQLRLYDADLLHPSRAGSRVIGLRVAQAIAAVEAGESR